MQSRELPRVVSADAQVREIPLDEEGTARSRFARLDFVRTPRRYDWFRLGLGLLLALAILASVVYFGGWATHSAVAWLHARPKYQLSFEKIELSPPAPPWILGGNRTILQGVLENSREVPEFSVPALQSGRLTEAFKKSPWVHRVEAIRFSYPNRVVVELAYKKPVAAIRPNHQTLIVLDEDGDILPDQEIDSDQVALSASSTPGKESLIPIQGQSKVLPRDRSPGTKWKTSPIDAKPTESDRRVYQGARLAGFLNQKLTSAASDSKAQRIFTIDVSGGEGDRCDLMILNFERAWIRWGAAPGEEAPGDLKAEEKWSLFIEWTRQQPRPPVSQGYWTFQKDGMKFISTQPK